MIQFKPERKIIIVGDAKVGGQPGELATVLIGSIFHRGHRIIKDAKQGRFDLKKAEHLIRKQEEFSKKTGKHARGLHESLKVMVGVSSISFEYAKEIGADLYAEDAFKVAEVAAKAMGGKSS